MLKKGLMVLVLVSMLLLTGCWDRLELNDRAIILGWGMDLLEDGTYMGTANIVLPLAAKQDNGSGSGGNPGYLTESAVGKDILDAGQNIQKKLSRVNFSGHRRNIFIGQKLAEKGLDHLLDEYGRSPTVRPRSNIFIVKGGTAQQAMALFYKLETNPSIAVQKIQEKIGAPISRSLLDFFIMINKDNGGIIPTIRIINPVVPPEKRTKDDSPPQATLEIDGAAIIDKNLNVRGYLETEEFWLRLWIADRLKQTTITKAIGGKNNTVSIAMASLHGKITPVFHGDDVSFNVKLTGSGEINENNTPLDVSKQPVIKKIENQMDEMLEDDIRKILKKVQKGFGCDVFGFQDSICLYHPYKWKKMRDNWDQIYKQAEINVKVDIKITGTGLADQSLLPERSGEPKG